jgi:hypothetical protein
MTYSCTEDDPVGGPPTCESAIQTPPEGCEVVDSECYGTADRVCLDGACSIGTDVACVEDSFCERVECVPQVEGSCVTIPILPYTVPDTDPPIVFDYAKIRCGESGFVSTLYSQNTVDNYEQFGGGGPCVGSYTGADRMFQIELAEDDTTLPAGTQLTITASDQEVTDNEFSILILSGCNESTCLAVQDPPGGGTTVLNYTVPASGDYFIVVDMLDNSTTDPGFGTATLDLVCGP